MTHRRFAALTAVWITATTVASAESTWPLFAFCMDTHDAKQRSLVAGFLKVLRGLGYKGPVGLQCYGLPGDARDHLTRSIAAWRKLPATP